MVEFLGYALFAQLLGASVFGTFVLFQAVMGLASIAVNPGIDNALAKRISGSSDGQTGNPGEPSATFLTTAILMKISAAVVVFVFIVVFRSPLNGYFGADIALSLIPVMIAYESTSLLLRTLYGELRVDVATTIQMVRRTVFITVGVALVFFDFGVFAPIYGLFTGYVVAAGTILYVKRTPFGRPSISAAKSLIGFAKYNFLESIVGTQIHSWTDTVIIGLLLTQAEVGVYEIAWRITGASMLFTRSITSSIFPQVSDWDAVDMRERIESIVPTAITGALFFIVPGIAGSILVGTEVLEIVFGSEFAVAALVLTVLMAGRVPHAVNGVFSRLLMGLDRPDLTAYSATVFIVLNVVLNFVLVAEVGLIGAAIATSGAFLVNTLLNGRYLSRFIDIEISLRDVASLVFATAGMSAVVFLVERLVRIDGLLTLAAVVGIGGVSYLTFSLAIPELRSRIVRTIHDSV